MKKFWKYIAACAAVVAMLPLTACDDDDTVDPYTLNYCYLLQPNDTFAKVEYKANGDLMGDLQEPWQLMPVRLTKPAPHDMNIQISLDPALVEEYNLANGTEYTYLSDAEVLTPVMHIAKGEYISPDSIKIGFGNHAGFLSGAENLMLPVVISNADGAVISKSSRIFLTFNSTYDPLIVSMARVVKEVAVNVEKEGWKDLVSTITLDGGIALNYAPFETLTANIEFDASKVDTYNQVYGTNYEFKSDATLATKTVSMAAGAENGTITINTGSLTGFEEGKSYVLPIVLKSVEGCSAQLDADATITYVVIRSVGDEVTISNSVVNGTQFTIPAGTKVTVDGKDKYGSYTWLRIIDNTNYAYGYMLPNEEMFIDFGEVVQLSAFYVNFYYGSYAASSLKLATSEDGVTYNEWEPLSWTDRFGQAYFNLAYTADVRYMKIVYPTAYNGSSIEIDGMKFYTN